MKIAEDISEAAVYLIPDSVRQTGKNNTGLANLNARFLLICNKNIEVSNNENDFTVTIPLIN